MAATTIGRESMTDGTTVWNVARIGSAIYDRVDALIASNITFGGTVSAEGFGVHNFSTGGTGANVLAVRNTTSGTTNYAELRTGNNSSATIGRLMAFSSAYTSGGAYVASAAVLEGSGAGGLNLFASDASGQIKFWTGGSSTSYVRIGSGGYLVQTRSPIYDPDTSVVTALGAGCFLNAVAGIVELTSGNFVDVDVYGMTTQSTGQVVIILNSDSGRTYTLYHESASALAASQRFNLPGDVDLTLGPGEAVQVVYSGTLSRWVACLG